jgi:hypothetical protein
MHLRADPTEKLEVVSALTLPALRKDRFSAPDHLIAMQTNSGKDKEHAKLKDPMAAAMVLAHPPNDSALDPATR